MIETIIAAIAGSTVLSTLITFLFARRKDKVDTDSVVIKHIFEWADKMKEEMVELKSKIDELTRENLKLQSEILELRSYVKPGNPV